MEKYDVIIIGGGLLGCFAARNLARRKLSIALLEQREDICTGISSSNTAIVYSGCDIRHGTVKAQLCVKAAQSFGTLCEELGVRYSPCGTLMVSFGDKGTETLRRKLHQGEQNGVRNMRLLGSDELLQLEPQLSDNVKLGLYLPDSGTVLPWELCLAAAENAAANGVQIHLNTQVQTIQQIKGGKGYIIGTPKGDYECKAIINCSGLKADSIHEMLESPPIRIVPSACDYMLAEAKDGFISHIIAHEPEEKGKGLTLVPIVDGKILIGSTDRSGRTFETDKDGIEKLYSMLEQVMPTLGRKSILRSFAAVRPNPYALICNEHNEYSIADRSINDFCIVESKDKTLLSFIGIKTPGLTCANELGLYAAAKLAQTLDAPLRTDFMPTHTAPVRLGSMSFAERQSFISQADAAYSRIVCRCHGVSEGEIIDAIRSNPPAITLDGIKRRTGAGGGSCQGSFCTQKIIELLAKELHTEPESIMKNKAASNIILGKCGL